MMADQWLDWSRSWWRTADERAVGVRWEASYPSNGEWAKRLGIGRATIYRWDEFGVSGGQTSGWSILFNELEGPDWKVLRLEPMPRTALSLFVDLLGSRSAVGEAFGLDRHVIGEWLMADAVTTSFGWSALLWWLYEDLGFGDSPPSKGVTNGIEINPKAAAFIRSQAISNVPSRVIAQRTGCSHTTVQNVLRRGNDD